MTGTLLQVGRRQVAAHNRWSARWSTRARRRSAGEDSRLPRIIDKAALAKDPDTPPSGALCGSVFLWQTELVLPAPFPTDLAFWLPRHSVVLAESDDGVVAFDFKPLDKDSLSSFVLLGGGSVPGRVAAKRLRKLPRGAVRLGNVAQDVRVDDVTRSLNQTFDLAFSLSSNDCNSYSREVLKQLLAQPDRVVGGRLYSTLDLDLLEQQGEAAYKEPSLLGVVVLVAGTTVGAGILAIPAVTQAVGFVPSSVVLFLCWAYMAITGLLIAEVALADMASSGRRATSLQSMAAKSIGPAGAVVSSLVFVVVHFGLLIAYLSRGGELLASILPSGTCSLVPPPAVFAALLGGLVFATKGSDALEQANNALAAIGIASFVVLVSFALPLADLSSLFGVADWSRTSDVAPTLLLALVYHNVVPTVCAQLEGDRSKITTAVVVGSFVPFVMYLVWNAVILAAVPPGPAAGGSGDPLSVLLASGGSGLSAGVLVFSLSAIATSFIGFLLSLTDFFADVLRPSSEAEQGESEESKLRDFALALALPLAVACYDPTLFFQAIDKVGAFGDSLLFGLLPACMALAQRARESPVLLQTPGFLGGYQRGPLVGGGTPVLMLVACGALAVVAENALELLGGE